MIGRTCIRNPATVLRHVLPTQLQAPWHLRRVPAPLARVRTNDDQRRAYAGGRGAGGGSKKLLKHGPPPRLKPLVWTLPRDDEITYKQVHMRVADGTLSEPRCTSEILDEIDRTRYSLAVIAMPGQQKKKKKWEGQANGDEGEGQGEGQGQGQGEEAQGLDAADGEGKQQIRYPICTIVDREAERAEHARKHEEALRGWEEARQLARRTKRVELNWAIAAHDLEHKMRTVRDFLRKGLRVEIALLDRANTRRDKKKLATREEATDVVRVIEAVAAEVPGTREVQAREGKLGQQLIIFLEGAKQDIKEPKEGERGNRGQGG